MISAGAFIARQKTILSQRIANNNFAVLMADLIGEGLSCTINSATSISVTKTAHGYTAANVGQFMMVGAISGANGVPGRYAIASIPDANTPTVWRPSSAAIRRGSGACRRDDGDRDEARRRDRDDACRAAGDFVMGIDLATLAAEVRLPQYAGLDEHQIAADLNEPRIDADRDVPVVEARRIVLLGGDLAKVRLLAEARPATAITPLAMTFADTMADRETVIPATAKPQIDGMLDALVAAGALSTASKAALMALFSTQISRAEQLFGERVGSGDISRAKALEV